jgi:hypothetical protein
MNYFIDERHESTLISEARLADRFGVSPKDIRAKIDQGVLPPADLAIENDGATEHYYTEQSADKLVKNCNEIVTSIQKETNMTSTSTTTSPATASTKVRTVRRLNSIQGYKVTDCLIKNFNKFNNEAVSWSQVVRTIKKETGVRVSNKTARDRMRKLASERNTELNAKLNVKQPRANVSRPSPKANSGTLVLNDGSTFKITYIGNKANKNNA